MIVSVGTDIVAVGRFIPWKEYSMQRLGKVFTIDEVAQCGGLPSLNHEKMASRFAAKEAFYKALCAGLLYWRCEVRTFSLIGLCQCVALAVHPWGTPSLIVDHDALERLCGATIPQFRTHVSLSHEKTMAVAVVILESVDL